MELQKEFEYWYHNVNDCGVSVFLEKSESGYKDKITRSLYAAFVAGSEHGEGAIHADIAATAVESFEALELQFIRSMAATIAAGLVTSDLILESHEIADDAVTIARAIIAATTPAPAKTPGQSPESSSR